MAEGGLLGPPRRGRAGSGGGGSNSAAPRSPEGGDGPAGAEGPKVRGRRSVGPRRFLCRCGCLRECRPEPPPPLGAPGGFSVAVRQSSPSPLGGGSPGSLPVLCPAPRAKVTVSATSAEVTLVNASA